MYEIYCKLRDAKDVKDADVSRATGITKSTFSEWKVGRSRPKGDKLRKIADYFGVSIDYLMGIDKAIVPMKSAGGLSPEYIGIILKAREEGFTPKDIETALNMLKIARREDG